MHDGKPLEITVSGSSMHVKVKHPDKYEEFRKNFAEIKKTAIVKESATRMEVPGPEPPKIVEKEKPPEPPRDLPKEPEKIKEGDGQPGKGGSFLEDFNKWLDSPEF